MSIYTYLTMTAGDRAGEHFLLDPAVQFRLGRGLDCQFVLGDPSCSRVHAVLSCVQGRWKLADNGSLNGTFVNEAKIDEAILAPGDYLKMGSTEFVFRQSDEPPSAHFDMPANAISLTQTVIRDSRVDGSDAGLPFLGALQDSPQVRRLLLLYQLSIRLLRCKDSDEVLRVSLDLLKSTVNASLVGFLWLSEGGRLKPRMVLPTPTGAESVPLNEALTGKVCNERKAIWVSEHQPGEVAAGSRHFADALCIPLVSDQAVLGVLHVYLTRGRFQQDQFDFAISVAGIVSVALVRAYRGERLETDLERLRAKTAGFDELIGDSGPMRELKAKILRLGKAGGCILIRGESGTGKELVARALHRHGSRADRPMLAVNCAAIPADLMESQLFGHKAGAFTGADRDHQGFFQQADGGTLFLDEAGELTLAGQAKLLRILEGHPFLPVGATEEVRVDVRVIAATNQDLQTYVRERKFREDLYYRLGVFEVFLPPLRERGDDLVLLTEHFLAHFRGQHGRPELTLTAEAWDRLLKYHWPGNVRQLRNVMDSAVVLAGGERIEAQDLGLRDSGDASFDSLRIEDWEQKLIREALVRAGGNVPEAAKLLGLARATLYRKLEQYGISRSPV